LAASCELKIGNACFVGSRRGVVYIGFSRQARIAYVGQTAGGGGVIGRWSHHLSASTSSFWRRVDERGECSADSISDLEVFASELGSEPQWNGAESSYREAAEYLVQVGLRGVSGDLVPYLRIISEVRANETCELRIVRDRAAEILSGFLALYSR
jgi:hypothetical protein